MNETPINADLEAIIRASLEQTKVLGWSDEDRRLSASSAALKYVEANSDLDDDVAIAVCKALVRDIMAEEEPLLRYCVHCGRYHPINDLDAGWHCPMERDPE